MFQFLSVSENILNASIIANLDKNVTNQYKNFIKTFITYFDIQKKLKYKIGNHMINLHIYDAINQ